MCACEMVNGLKQYARHIQTSSQYSKFQKGLYIVERIRYVMLYIVICIYT